MKGNFRKLPQAQGEKKQHNGIPTSSKKRTTTSALPTPRKQQPSHTHTESHDYHMHMQTRIKGIDDEQAINEQEEFDSLNYEEDQEEEHDHDDAEIDYDQLCDYRSASHSPVSHLDTGHSAAVHELDPVEEQAAMDTSSPLPLCPPRHKNRKSLYEYESLDVERGLIRLPRWLESSHRRTRLDTLLSERFEKRYPVSWRKRTHMPVYHPKHYADVF